MKKKLKFISIFLSILLTTCSMTKVNAETRPAYGNYKLNWNIENIYYYVNSNAEKYSGYIQKAANNWVYTGLGYNKLWPNTRIYDIYGTAVDFYTEEYQSDRVEATTYTYNWVNGVKKESAWLAITTRIDTGIPAENYTFAEIIINNYAISRDPSYYTDSRIQGIIAHEFGHAWGLGHNPENINSLMQNLSNYRKNTVQQVDQDVFNILYP